MIAGLVGQAVLVVSGVIAARLLSVDDRGELALLGLIPLIVSQLGGLGLPLAATYTLARQPTSAAAVAKLLGGILPARSLALSVVHMSVVAAITYDRSDASWLAAAVTVPAVPALLCQQVGLGILQGQGRFRAFNAFRLLPLVGYASVLAGAAIMGFTSLAVFSAGWTIAWATAGTLTIAVGFRRLGATSGEEPVDRKSFVSFGRRGVVGSIFPLEAFQLDQVVVAVALAPRELALYVVAASLANLPRFVSQSIGMVAYPRIARQRDEVVQWREMWRFFCATTAAAALLVGALWSLADWVIPFFFGERYRPGVGIARILLIAAVFQAGRRVLADGMRGLGRPGLSTGAEILSWFVFVPAVVILGRYGAEGIAGAVGVTAAISMAALMVGTITVRASAARASRESSTTTQPPDGVDVRLRAVRPDETSPPTGAPPAL